VPHHAYKIPRTKRLRALNPRWMHLLDVRERAHVLDLDEAIDMHRRLLRPLMHERMRIMRMAQTRLWRARTLEAAAASNAATADAA
jgi:hypothetical protein